MHDADFRRPPSPGPARPGLFGRPARVLLLLTLAGLIAFANRQPLERMLNAAATAARAPEATRAVTPRGALLPDEQATVDLFERSAPSVVYVSTIGHLRRVSLTDIEDTTFRDGTGSGFVWDREGHIVTNFHVIAQVYAQRRECEVTFKDDGTSYPADIVGVAQDKDLAVLRVKAPAEKLKPISLGSSQDLKIGQNVYAIGNPFGLDYTLTRGVVSALNREMPTLTGRRINNVVQTDAAINPGNSGGPLLDSAGRLVGVTTMMRSDGQNIGFAIPSDTVNQVIPRVIRNGGLRVGLGMQLMSRELTTRNGVSQGLIVRNVPQGSAAERAGMLNPGQAADGRFRIDILLKVGSVDIKTEEDVSRELEMHQPGDAVPLLVLRGGEGVWHKTNLMAQVELQE